MRFEKLVKGIAPAIGMAVAAGLASRGNGNWKVNGSKGEPLDTLDLTGEAPTEVALLGPDSVEIHTGANFSIEVDGDEECVSGLRFVREGSSLAVMRSSDEPSGTARVVISLPSPRKLTVAGSGAIAAAELTGDAELSVLGSGWLEVAGVSADTLSVTLAGSGSAKASGKVGKLDLNVLGSGSARLDGLEAASAKVTIAGSGSVTFASDGEVAGEILGSGSATVRGDATCRVRTIGSGALVCERHPAKAA